MTTYAPPRRNVYLVLINHAETIYAGVVVESSPRLARQTVFNLTETESDQVTDTFLIGYANPSMRDGLILFGPQELPEPKEPNDAITT